MRSFMYRNLRGFEESSKRIRAKSPISLLTILLIKGLLVLSFHRSAADPQLDTESSNYSFIQFYLLIAHQFISNNMKNRKVVMEPIREANLEDSKQIYQKSDHNNSGSSDFSDFDLAPKDIADIDFSPYHKTAPKLGKQKKYFESKKNKKAKVTKSKLDENKQTIEYGDLVIKVRDLKKKQKRQNEGELKKTKKDKNRGVERKKKPEDARQGQNLNDFKETKVKFEENPSNIQKQLIKQEQLSEKEELIVEYDKMEFKKTIKQCVTEERSNSKPRKHQASVDSQNCEMENMTGSCVFESKGGICFDLNVKEFTSPPPKRAQSSQKSQKKKQKQLKKLNSNEQILRRRQMAFNYGKLIRMRTFGYL